jgi:serine protease
MTTRTHAAAAALILLSLSASSEGATIRVPADAATIQQGIDAALDGDTVLVSAGTYYERINFHGKAITLASEQGPDVTAIDGSHAGTVVTFLSREGRGTVLTGFTIRNGFNAYSGAGIHVGSSSPTIRGNIVTRNSGCSGVGIFSASSAPRIEGNQVIANSTDTCTGGWGTGIYILGSAGAMAAEIIDNEISGNTSIGSTSGGGLGLFGSGNVLVQRNIVARNVTLGSYGCGWGGGIASANYTQATLIDNLIVRNSACFGGGVQWDGTTGKNVWINNTIADNDATYYPGLYIFGYTFNDLYNNIITAASGPAVFCEYTQLQHFYANDVFSSQAASWGGSCTDQTGINGNISADPGFVDPMHRDYRLKMTSPAIDAGDDGTPQLPAVDLSGSARVFDGDGDGVPRVDMGAFEYHNHAPVVSAGPDQTITLGSDCAAGVTLTASGSDPDGDALTYIWTSVLGSMTSTTITVAPPAGTYTFTLTADDGNGGFASDTVVVTVLDVTPPSVSSAGASPSVIPVADHRIVPVVISVSASDQCGGAFSCRVVNVTSNEPVDGLGDGDTSPDWEITGDLTVQVRAERAGTGTGRVYAITIACVDTSGNQTTSVVTVTVPKN